MQNLAACVVLCVLYLSCGYEVLAALIMIIVHVERIAEMHTQ